MSSPFDCNLPHFQIHSYPAFPGTEMDYLRAQVARVQAPTPVPNKDPPKSNIFVAEHIAISSSSYNKNSAHSSMYSEAGPNPTVTKGENNAQMQSCNFKSPNTFFLLPSIFELSQKLMVMTYCAYSSKEHIAQFGNSGFDKN